MSSSTGADLAIKCIERARDTRWKGETGLFQFMHKFFDHFDQCGAVNAP